MRSSSSKRKRVSSSTSTQNKQKGVRSTRPPHATTPSLQPASQVPHLPTSSRFPSSRTSSSKPNCPDYDPEDESQIHKREETDDVNQVIMAIDVNNKGAVGCSYYVASEEKLYMLQDVKAGGEAVVDMLKAEIEPTIVLLSTRVGQGKDRNVEDRTPFENSDDDRFKLPYEVEVRPNQEFKLENARSKLLNLRLSSYDDQLVKFLVPGDSIAEDGNELQAGLGFNGQQGKFLYLSGVVDMENAITVGCAGAVLTHLQRMRTSVYLPGDTAANALFRVTSMEMFGLKETMFINSDTLYSLQILQSESHPNAFNQGPGKGSSRSKESLSVYGLFHHLARTPQGKQRLRQMFLRPSLNIDTINERLDFISVFLQPDNAVTLDKIVQGLKRVKNLRPVMVHLRKGISAGNSNFGGIRSGVWATLLAFAFHMLDVEIAIRDVSNAHLIAILAEVLKKLDSHLLHEVGRLIHEKIDLDLSIVHHRAVVKRGINEELDNMKETYEGIDDLLRTTARKIVSEITDQDLELNVIYFPQIGFLVTIPAANADRLVEEGSLEEGKWERMFTSNNQVYYKEFRTKEMDDTFGDIYALICDLEIEIVHELAQEVLKYEDMLVDASDICGELDCLLALAQGAQMHKFARPRITEENVIEILAGRHPLQELTVPSYVSNDTLVAGGDGDDKDSLQKSTHERNEGPSMLVLTGPNYSGKSVYQKQVALIVYLTHVGSFVPAESAKIGLTDKILTRITTPETVSKVQSAFLIDLQQISLAITLATRRSLLIIDEFGKGTDSNDGAGLCCGVLEYLLSLGEDRPKVLAATHFHEIFENGFLPPRPDLAFGHMEVLIDAHAKSVENQITYLYNFRKGKNNASFGTSCAAMNGIDPLIIERANELSLYAARGDDLLAVCADVSPEETEQLMDAEVIARTFVTKNFSIPVTDSSEGYATNDPRTSLEEVFSVVAQSS